MASPQEGGSLRRAAEAMNESPAFCGGFDEAEELARIAASVLVPEGSALVCRDCGNPFPDKPCGTGCALVAHFQRSGER